jgi:transcriptional regulator with XRE-family HTH domain
MNKKTLLKQFGKNVKIERIKQDLTQEQLAEIMKVSQNYVANIECGKANMSLAKVLELSQSLNVHISKLLAFSDYELN